MKVMPAGKAKNAFGLLIDTARAEPVTIEKHGRAVAVMLSVEEYERLKNAELHRATSVDRRDVPAEAVMSDDQKAG
jgi:prevent-host-death family protein